MSGKTCVVSGCKNKESPGSEISFHRFPLKQKNVLLSWLTIVSIEDWVPSAHSRMCSDHFESKTYDKQYKKQGKRLIRGSFPTIFAAHVDTTSGDDSLSSKASLKDIAGQSLDHSYSKPNVNVSPGMSVNEILKHRMFGGEGEPNTNINRMTLSLQPIGGAVTDNSKRLQRQFEEIGTEVHQDSHDVEKRELTIGMSGGATRVHLIELYTNKWHKFHQVNPKIDRVINEATLVINYGDNFLTNEECQDFQIRLYTDTTSHHNPPSSDNSQVLATAPPGSTEYNLSASQDRSQLSIKETSQDAVDEHTENVIRAPSEDDDMDQNEEFPPPIPVNQGTAGAGEASAGAADAAGAGEASAGAADAAGAGAAILAALDAPPDHPGHWYNEDVRDEGDNNSITSSSEDNNPLIGDPWVGGVNSPDLSVEPLDGDKLLKGSNPVGLGTSATNKTDELYQIPRRVPLEESSDSNRSYPGFDLNQDELDQLRSSNCAQNSIELGVPSQDVLLPGLDTLFDVLATAPSDSTENNQWESVEQHEILLYGEKLLESSSPLDASVTDKTDELYQMLNTPLTDSIDTTQGAGVKAGSIQQVSDQEMEGKTPSKPAPPAFTPPYEGPGKKTVDISLENTEGHTMYRLDNSPPKIERKKPSKQTHNDKLHLVRLQSCLDLTSAVPVVHADVTPAATTPTAATPFVRNKTRRSAVSAGLSSNAGYSVTQHPPYQGPGKRIAEGHTMFKVDNSPPKIARKEPPERIIDVAPNSVLAPIPTLVLGVSPEPVPISAPNLVLGSALDPVPRSAPDPVPGSVPNVAPGRSPDLVPRSTAGSSTGSK